MLVPWDFVSFCFFSDSARIDARVEETKSTNRFKPEKCTTEPVAWRWEHVGYSEVLGRFLVGLGALWGLAGYIAVLGRSLAGHWQVPRVVVQVLGRFLASSSDALWVGTFLPKHFLSFELQKATSISEGDLKHGPRELPELLKGSKRVLEVPKTKLNWT